MTASFSGRYVRGLRTPACLKNPEDYVSDAGEASNFARNRSEHTARDGSERVFLPSDVIFRQRQLNPESATLLRNALDANLSAH